MQTSSAVNEYSNPSVYQVPPGSLNAKDNPNPGPMGNSGSSFSDVMASQAEQSAPTPPKPPQIPGLTAVQDTPAPASPAAPDTTGLPAATNSYNLSGLQGLSGLPGNYSQITRSFLSVTPGIPVLQNLQSNALMSAYSCTCGYNNIQTDFMNFMPMKVLTQRMNPGLASMPEFTDHALKGKLVTAIAGDETVSGIVNRVIYNNGVTYAEIDDGERDNLKYVPVSSITEISARPSCPDNGNLLVYGKGFIKLSADMTMQLGIWSFSNSRWKWIYEAFAEPIMVISQTRLAENGNSAAAAGSNPGSGSEITQLPVSGINHGSKDKGSSGRGGEGAVDGSRHDKVQARESEKSGGGAAVSDPPKETAPAVPNPPAESTPAASNPPAESTPAASNPPAESTPAVPNPPAENTPAAPNPPAGEDEEPGRGNGRTDESRGSGRKENGHREAEQIRNKSSEDNSTDEIKEKSGKSRDKSKDAAAEPASESEDSGE